MAFNFSKYRQDTSITDDDILLGEDSTTGRTRKYSFSSILTWFQSNITGTGGDMLKSVFDPTGVNGDAFDMDNMAEGSTNLILTSAERTSIGTAIQPDDLSAVATSGAYSDLSGTPTIPTVDDTAYDATSWNGNTDAPTKNAVRDKIESLTLGGAVTSVNTQTGAVVLDADDIDDTSTTNKFVTSTDLTKLSNTSGTNTGDQDLSGYAQKTGDSFSGDVTFNSDVYISGSSIIATDSSGEFYNLLVTQSPVVNSDVVNKGYADSTYQDILAEGAFVDGDKTKLNGIATGAQVNTINSSTSGEPTGSDQVLNVVSLTQAEYDAGTPVATTFYVITG